MFLLLLMRIYETRMRDTSVQYPCLHQALVSIDHIQLPDMSTTQTSLDLMVNPIATVLGFNLKLGQDSDPQATKERLRTLRKDLDAWWTETKDASSKSDGDVKTLIEERIRERKLWVANDGSSLGTVSVTVSRA